MATKAQMEIKVQMAFKAHKVLQVLVVQVVQWGQLVLKAQQVQPV
jgi:hypothetical protein